jgi:hypothetical protein
MAETMAGARSTLARLQGTPQARPRSISMPATAAECSSPPAARTVAPRLSAKRCGPPTGYQAPWV